MFFFYLPLYAAVAVLEVWEETLCQWTMPAEPVIILLEEEPAAAALAAA